MSLFSLTHPSQPSYLPSRPYSPFLISLSLTSLTLSIKFSLTSPSSSISLLYISFPLDLTLLNSPSHSPSNGSSYSFPLTVSRPHSTLHQLPHYLSLLHFSFFTDLTLLVFSLSFDSPLPYFPVSPPHYPTYLLSFRLPLPRFTFLLSLTLSHLSFLLPFPLPFLS